jgi:hypothetical protein
VLLRLAHPTQNAATPTNAVNLSALTNLEIFAREMSVRDCGAGDKPLGVTTHSLRVLGSKPCFRLNIYALRKFEYPMDPANGAPVAAIWGQSFNTV